MNAFQICGSPISIIRRCHGWPSRSGVRRNPTYELILLDDAAKAMALAAGSSPVGHRMPILLLIEIPLLIKSRGDAGADDYVVKRKLTARMRFTAPRKFLPPVLNGKLAPKF